MKRRTSPAEPQQLEIPLDAPKLRELNADQRTAVLGALAGLLLEAADTVERGDDDESV